MALLKDVDFPRKSKWLVDDINGLLSMRIAPHRKDITDPALRAFWHDYAYLYSVEPFDQWRDNAE